MPKLSGSYYNALQVYTAHAATAKTVPKAAVARSKTEGLNRIALNLSRLEHAETANLRVLPPRTNRIKTAIVITLFGVQANY